jgi:hypothetical protein
MKNTTAQIIKSDDQRGVRIIKYNNLIYTVFGRLFAVRGNHESTAWGDVCDIAKKYEFSDWNNLSGMYLVK